jgi:hypothetical protein
MFRSKRHVLLLFCYCPDFIRKAVELINVPAFPNELVSYNITGRRKESYST